MIVIYELTGSQLYDNYTIHYIIIIHSSGVGLQQTKEKKIYNILVQFFFLK